MTPNHEEFSLRERVSVLTRNKWLLVLFCVSAMGSSLLFTYIYSERYRAVSTLVYRPTEDIRFQSREKQSLGFPVPMLPFEVIGHTIGQIGTSEVILREVVTRLRLDEEVEQERAGLSKIYHDTKTWLKDRIKDAKQIAMYGRIIERNPTSAAIELLARNVSIETTRKDYTAYIEVVDKNPHRAAAIVDVLGEVLVRFFQEESIRSARELREELQRQMADKKAEIDATMRSLESLKNEFQFSELDEETSLKLRRVDDLEGKLAEVTVDINKTTAKLNALSAQRAEMQQMIVASQTVADDPLYTKLEEMQSDRQVELRGLRQRLPDDHIEVKMLSAELETIGQTLSELDNSRVIKQTSSINDVYVTIHAKEQDAAATLEGQKAARQSIEQELATFRSRLSDPAIKTKHRDLLVQLDVLEDTYAQLSESHAESRIAELKNVSEIRVLHKATPQELPFRPIKAYHVLAAGLLALIAGTGFVYFLDFWRLLMRRDARAGVSHS